MLTLPSSPGLPRVRQPCADVPCEIFTSDSRLVSQAAATLPLHHLASSHKTQLIDLDTSILGQYMLDWLVCVLN